MYLTRSLLMYFLWISLHDLDLKFSGGKWKINVAVTYQPLIQSRMDSDQIFVLVGVWWPKTQHKNMFRHTVHDKTSSFLTQYSLSKTAGSNQQINLFVYPHKQISRWRRHESRMKHWLSLHKGNWRVERLIMFKDRRVTFSSRTQLLLPLLKLT